MTAAQWASLEPIGTINNVTINSPPVVTFTLTDGSGNAIVGLESMTTGTTTNSSGVTTKYPTYPNLAFSIAKLVPATNGSPSRWVSYEVLGTPNTTSDFTPGGPSTENYGTLEAVAGVPGQYKYTFRRDPKAVKALIDGATYVAPKAKEDLDDLTYDANLTHRVGIQFSGNARGTSTNTANGSNSGVDAVPLDKPVNFFYDFIPATGARVTATDTQREIVSVAACFECHSKFVGFHGGTAVNKFPASRQDTRMCVLCHTDQRKFGSVAATTTTTGYTGDVNRVNGMSTLNLSPFIHTLHMGEKLTKKGTTVGGILANEIKYPQTITNCVKCHDGTSGAKNQTAQGDNWKTKPSRLACNSCHDKVNFATGENHPAPDGKSIQTDDATCATCHDAASISTVYHVTVDPTGSVDRGGYLAGTPGYPASSTTGNAIALASMVNPPAGVFKIKFEIASVTVDSTTKYPTVKYRILKDGVPAILNAAGYLIDDVDGTPSIYVTYGQPQDGVTKVVDWTGSLNATVTQFRDAQTALNVSTSYSQTGPEATTGYYSATFKTALPTGYAMVYGAMGINYGGLVQLKGYKTIVNGVATDVPIRLRESAFALVPLKTSDVRRPIVTASTCNACHAQLGVEPSFHSGARNNPEGCAMGGCHNETKATSHTDGGGWALSEKYMVHGIHGGWKRTVPFTYAASSGNLKGFSEVEYPGVLNNCRQCHLPGSFDFSNAANANAIPGMLWTTDSASDMRLLTNSGTATTDPLSWVGVSPWIIGVPSGKLASNKALPTVLDRVIPPLGANGGYNDYRVDNVVSSPVASACFGCHDAPKSINHMEQNGGVLVKQVSTVLANAGMTPAVTPTTAAAYRALLTGANKEACLICHGTGKVADIKVVHGVK
jgi:OmcA/MtrC family decaheme c-type cytochrome